MNSERTAVHVILASATVLLAGVVQAEPVLSPTTGHYYEVLPGPAITWDEADAIAAGLSHLGVPGHLATITSAEEDQFVDQLRQDALDDSVIAQPQVWIGGYQADGAGEPGEGWQWVNGEGAIPGTDSTDPYANWALDEPNDTGEGDGLEQHLTLGRFGLGAGWNDEGSAPETIGGFIVEFDNTAAAGNCLEDDDGASELTGGCNPSGVQLVQLPNESVIQPGYSISQFLVKPDPDKKDDYPQAQFCPGDYAFPDIRVDVNGRPNGPMVPLDVFAVLGGGEPGALIMDAHTYGSPCFAVVKGAANFELVDVLVEGGVATNTQYPDDVPGIGGTFACYDPVTNPDLQLGTQFTYQTDDLQLMAERTAAAMTNYCNSPSRGATFKFSYYVLNTHEDCGLDRSQPGGRKAVIQCFEDLAVAKFDMLEIALFAAADSLVRPKFSALTSKLNKARSMIDTGQYAKGEARLLELLNMVRSGTWTPDSDNDPGNLEMRILNLLFRIDQLQAARATP